MASDQTLSTAAAVPGSDTPLPLTVTTRSNRVVRKPVDLYVEPNKKAIARVVRNDRKKDLLGELSDWKATHGALPEHASLYWVPLSEKDSYETVAHEHGRIAAALGIPLLDDEDASDTDENDNKDDDDDKEYSAGDSQVDSSDSDDGDEDSGDDDDDDDEAEEELDDDDDDEEDDDEEDDEEGEEDDDDGKAAGGGSATSSDGEEEEGAVKRRRL